MALAQAQQTITTTQAQVTASVGTRVYLAIRNMGPNPIFIGATGVLPSTGMPILPGEFRQWDQSVQSFAGESVFAITESGTARIRVLEAS